MSDDVNLAKIATALERIATVAERIRPAPMPTSGVVPGVPFSGPPTPTVPPPPEAPSSNRTEFQFSASAGARLREGDKHDAEHKGVKPGRNGGLYCPTKLSDGSWCQWRQAA